jgi:KDO2-lipid IV(A) lauroyltransferase
MAIRLQTFLNSRLGIAVGLALSKVPTAIGYPFAQFLADRIAAQKSNPMVRALRANQWIVHDERPSGQELDRLVRQTYRSTARSLYEFWHFFRDPRAVQGMVDFDQSFTGAIDQARREDRGTLLVVPHLSNFDLIGRAAVLNGIPLHILSYPQPPGGYRWQNTLRQLPGLTITPMSIDALRHASGTLRNQGVVATGVDRPLPGEDRKYQSRFFGRLATLPVFHVRLALKHNLPIVVVSGCRKANGGYHVWASLPIQMDRSPDLVCETVQNAEKVLAVTAEYIRKAPDQWAMFYPVWPEALDQMPA